MEANNGLCVYLNVAMRFHSPEEEYTTTETLGNSDIREELNIDNIQNKVVDNKRNSNVRTDRMGNTRLPLNEKLLNNRM